MIKLGVIELTKIFSTSVCESGGYHLVLMLISEL